MADASVLENILKLFFVITSPVTFLVGVFLLYDINVYLGIERFLARSYGVSKKRLINGLEKNRESLQMFLLKWRRSVGLVCLLNSVFALITSFILLKK